jgi:hypothetical protein
MVRARNMSSIDPVAVWVREVCQVNFGHIVIPAASDAY